MDILTHIKQYILCAYFFYEYEYFLLIFRRDITERAKRGHYLIHLSNKIILITSKLMWSVDNHRRSIGQQSAAAFTLNLILIY